MLIFLLEKAVATPWRLVRFSPPIDEKVADADRETDKEDHRYPHRE